MDELQEAKADELRAVNTAVHRLGQDDVPLPLFLVGAGLPSLPAQLAEATSYAERLYDYRPIGLLGAPASLEALVVPARDRGIDWEPGAAHTAVEAAQGYPYFLQAIGKHVWDSAVRSPIQDDDVRVGLVAARREVDDGLYRSRWECATRAQREVLRALATTGGSEGASIADIGRAMGKSKSSELSVARNQLIKKGLTYAPERGILAFTVPGMEDFINRQP